MLYKDHPAADIQSAVEKALSANVSGSEAVEHILKSTGHDPVFASLPNWQSIPVPDISIYEQIGGGR